MTGSFFDTNTLLYLLADDPIKVARSEELLILGGTISVQVLNEVTNVSLRKRALPWEQTRQFLAELRHFLTILPLTEAVHAKGLDVAERYRFALDDSMIIAAALTSGCETLWSEDLRHGQVIEGTLTIRDPYRAD